MRLKGLQIALAVQGGGEGHVVEGLLGRVGPHVGLHALDTVFGLVGGKLSLQFLGKNVRLKKKKINK